MRTLVVGGYGNFGARICRALSGDSGIELLIGGPDAARCDAMAAELGNGARGAPIDIGAPGLEEVLRKMQVQLVIHTAGPFQAQGHGVAQATAGAGAHFIDLSDGRRFVCEFPEAMNATLQAAGRPARRERGQHLAGPVLRRGWANPERVMFARLRPRRGALCDIPDLELFPHRFSVARRLAREADDPAAGAARGGVGARSRTSRPEPRCPTSGRGRGACRRFPAKDKSMTGAPQEQEDPQLPVPRSLRVLVIEDDPQTLALMLQMLELMGHWAAGVQSAELALSRFFDGAFDVVLTDVGLPALSGIDLAQTLIERHGARIVFATGHSEPETPLPGTVWLRKPFGADQLQEALDRALAI